MEFFEKFYNHLEGLYGVFIATFSILFIACLFAFLLIVIIALTNGWFILLFTGLFAFFILYEIIRCLNK